MESTLIKAINPLIETTETQSGQNARSADTSFFSAVFQSAIDKVRKTNAVQVNQEYKLATSQLDNPADLALATATASNAALLLMEPCNKAPDAYNEQARIPL